jgi:ABC-2 type transport system permease protein
MLAILRREISAYFNSTLAWILIAAFTFVLGIIFVSLLGIYSDASMMAASSPYGAQRLNPTERVIVPTFQWIGYLLLFILPVLTMRLIAEESRQGTLEMLFTYPLTDTEIVVGKFLGGLSVVGAIMAISSGLFVAMSRITDIEWKIVASGYLGVLLLGCAFVSFGLWASSLTSSQMISAAITYCGLLSSWLVVIVGEKLESWKEIFGDISSMGHLEEMARGTLSTHHVVYYLAWTVLFLFLTVRTLESRKWSS